MEHMKLHAAKTHGLKEVPPDIEKKIKANIKTVSLDVPDKK
jgi:predicted small metal-binding protein